MMVPTGDISDIVRENSLSGPYIVMVFNAKKSYHEWSRFSNRLFCSSYSCSIPGSAQEATKQAEQPG
jgi:hypothetical protein